MLPDKLSAADAGAQTVTLPPLILPEAGLVLTVIFNMEDSVELHIPFVATTLNQAVVPDKVGEI